MPSRATCRRADLATQIAAQHAAIARFEAALWDGGFNAALLPSLQSAWRRLEALYARHDADPRHRFKLLIPVADSPRQLHACLGSLLDLMRVYGYGGVVDGKYARVSVVVADDSGSPEQQAATRAVVEAYAASALHVDYFGQPAQAAFFARHGAALSGLIGTPDPARFGHKGQAAMRNLAALWLAHTLPDPAHTLVHTFDADQRFDLPIAVGDGETKALALNIYAHLDQIFCNPGTVHLTGKVVGDPPVSPAAMAGTVLDDLAALLAELAVAAPDAAWPQHARQRGADAAYHDMAALFGYAHDATFRYCPQSATTNGDVFDEFAARLQRFFHGEHPTRATVHEHRPALESVAPARTVYTGNWVWRADAPDACIPFAPLRLRMSGPTLGRLLRAANPARFVAANLPMRHTRTLDDTRAAEFRPGVIDAADGIDLSNEFARQFVGDVMLFTVERLTAQGFATTAPDAAVVAATLDAVRADLHARYARRQCRLREQLAALTAHFEHDMHWWHRGHDAACADLRAFFADMRRNFESTAPHAAADFWPGWRPRLLAALTQYDADRAAWQRALT